MSFAFFTGDKTISNSCNRSRLDFSFAKDQPAAKRRSINFSLLGVITMKKFVQKWFALINGYRIHIFTNSGTFTKTART